jgi:Copper transport outer membrane protein, MctB
MGYSPRYHAASLAAVFLALAIGILIGAEFGDDIVSSTRRNLEQSLTGNLADARDRADELAAELGDSNEFAKSIYPVLVQDTLRGRRIGVLALGSLSDEASSGIEAALEPTGARLVAIGVVREPPDMGGLASELSETRFADFESNSDTVQALGTGVGRQLVFGGDLLDKVRSEFFSRASGQFGNLDGLVVVRDQPDELDSEERSATGRLETGLLEGVEATRTTAVGVETSEADSSSVSYFQSRSLASVDDLDLVAGQVAMVFALLGAEGSFGVKDSADQLLPDLLAPGPVPAVPGEAEFGSGQGSGSR